MKKRVFTILILFISVLNLSSTELRTLQDNGATRRRVVTTYYGRNPSRSNNVSQQRNAGRIIIGASNTTIPKQMILDQSSRVATPEKKNSKKPITKDDLYYIFNNSKSSSLSVGRSTSSSSKRSVSGVSRPSSDAQGVSQPHVSKANETISQVSTEVNISSDSHLNKEEAYNDVVRANYNQNNSVDQMNIKQDIEEEYKKSEAEKVTRGVVIVDDHEAVDLGLSVLWATCNVGADTPEEYGGYYAWGELEEKYEYSIETYESSYNDGNNENGSYELGQHSDVAHMKWGGKWRLPTKEEIDELLQCSWQSMVVNGINGYKVIGANGNSIFLPSVGYRGMTYFDGLNRNAGYYWSSTAYFRGRAAFSLVFGDVEVDEITKECYSREIGLPVRPVNGKRKNVRKSNRSAIGKSYEPRRYVESRESFHINDAPLPTKTCELCGGSGRIAIMGGGMIHDYQNCTGCFGTGRVSDPFGMFY